MRSTTVAPLAAILALGAIAPLPATEAPVPVPPGISPEAQEFYRSLRPRPATQNDYNDPKTMQRLRNGLGNMFLVNARRITTDYTLEKVDAGGAPAYWVRTGAPRHASKAIVYLHGGGYILGSATTNLGLPLRIGPIASTPVLSVEYRLAPEHRFPAAMDDALAAYGWLLGRGYRGGDIAVMGDSAGGGLALYLRRRTRPARPAPAAGSGRDPGVAAQRRRATCATRPGSRRGRHARYLGRHVARLAGTSNRAGGKSGRGRDRALPGAGTDSSTVH
jgi:acetyl esterase/lipase